LAASSGNDPQEGNGDRYAPKAGGDRADVGESNEPWPERKRDVAQDERGKGERVRALVIADKGAPSC